MRIGELSTRTGVSVRMLRHYERRGLLHPERDPGGYRRYAPGAVARVARIRELLDAGLTTRQIAELLPCVRNSGPGLSHCERSARALDAQRDRLEGELADLNRRRSALAELTRATEEGAEVPPGTKGVFRK
ncbi:MerR family transcriptional regulator [Streptomyces sp. NPDC005438]|uniref:MerR family transcriptional regulator n=1 Tax=Streptomyces sp. NPDC005438 TaxID=3156880 RepID=UPI0033A42756